MSISVNVFEVVHEHLLETLGVVCLDPVSGLKVRTYKIRDGASLVVFHNCFKDEVTAIAGIDGMTEALCLSISADPCAVLTRLVISCQLSVDWKG